jgi:hypothetical protein
MKPILTIMRSDWKMRFLFMSLVVCVGLIIVMMVTLVKFI